MRSFPMTETGRIGKRMNILAVSSNAAILAELEGILKELYPGAAVTCAGDPLMAGKYAFHNKVDILLAETEMKRMNGVQLLRFVRQEQPAVRACLMGRADTLRDLPLSVQGEAAGLIAIPFTAADVAAALRGGTAEGREE